MLDEIGMVKHPTIFEGNRFRSYISFFFFFWHTRLLFHSTDDSSLLSESGSQEKEVVLPGGWGGRGASAAHLGKRAPARATSWDPFCQSLTRLRRSDMMAVLHF